MNKKIIQAPICRILFTSNLFKANLATIVHKTLVSEASQGCTVDKDEIKKHTQLANVWWDTNGPMKALHSYNHLRVPFVRDGIVDNSSTRTHLPLRNKTLLDVGCGGGILSEPLTRLGANVTGIDASQELIELAQEHSKNNSKLLTKPSYICTTIEEHSCKHIECYDGVVASEIIEHVSDKELFVKSCITTLKPGGRIFFTTPNRTRMSQIFGIYVAEYILNIVPRGTHQYEKFTTPNELTFILERIIDDKLHYLAVRPTASLLQIRQKLWYLLELPDYCDEVLVLKTEQDAEIPLTSFRKGNDPQHPYILEVWPGRQETNSRVNMIQMGESKSLTIGPSNASTYEADENNDQHRNLNNMKSKYMSNLMAEYTKSDLSCKVSTSTLFFKIHGKKSKDNFAHLLLKIQNDLSMLSNKLSNLEERIQ